MNGQVFLMVVAVCWAALAINLLGAGLKRLSALRKVGVWLQWLAFASYLLGVGGTAMFMQHVLSNSDWTSLAWVIGGLTFVPLAICTVQFFQAAKKHLTGAENAARLSS